LEVLLSNFFAADYKRRSINTDRTKIKGFIPHRHRNVIVRIVTFFLEPLSSKAELLGENM